MTFNFITNKRVLKRNFAVKVAWSLFFRFQKTRVQKLEETAR